jgi:alpha-L-fucosidase
MPNGKIQPEFVKTLDEVGQWLSKNGSTIYGSRGGAVGQKYWGVSTQKGNTTYLHILSSESQTLLISDKLNKVNNVIDFKTKEKLKFKQDEFGLSIILPKHMDDIDTIIELN